MTRLIWRISLWQIVPGRSGAKHPKDSIEYVPGRPKRSATILPWIAALRRRDVRFNGAPLILSEVHPDGRSKNRSAVDPERKNDLHPATYVRPVMRCALA